LHPYDVKALRRGDTKLMWWSRDGRVQLFDLASDPGEVHDLSDDQPERAAQLLGELRAWSAGGVPANRCDGIVSEQRLDHAPTPNLPLLASYPTFELLGMNLPASHVARGEALPLDLYYHVTSETDDSLFFRVTVEGPPGVALPEHFHCWHYPLHSCYPTDHWHAGEYLDDPCTLRIPTAVEMAIDARAHFRLTLQVFDGAGGIVTPLFRGDPVTVVPLGGFDVDP
jgi:hypothetical protein